MIKSNLREILKDSGISIQEYLSLLSIYFGENSYDSKDKNVLSNRLIFSSLIEKGLILTSLNRKYVMILPKGTSLVELIEVNMEQKKKNEQELRELASRMQEIFPEGKKILPGFNSQYWRGNKTEIVSALKRFFVTFDDGYTNEDIIDATKRYVDSFNGNYTLMRVLKYFIIKADRKQNSDGTTSVETISDLATFLENKDNHDSFNDFGNLCN